MSEAEHLDLGPEPPWWKPHQDNQPDMFPRPAGEILAWGRISIDAAKRWHSRGWLSFDPATLPQLSMADIWEIAFVRNIAESGLSDEQIDVFLSKLAKPYRYDPVRTAYSFYEHAWVECPPLDDIDRMFDSHIEDWIVEQAQEGKCERLLGLVGLIYSSLPKEALERLKK